MRPLIRPAWDPAWAGADPVLLLEEALGRYCWTCERRLPAGGVAWHAESGAVAERPGPESWDDLLLLCRDCAAAALAAGPSNAALSRPDRGLTFALRAQADFRYARHDDGHVLVLPGTAAAAETVRRFGLNDPGSIEDVPDFRVADRTEAWEDAEDAADRLQSSTSPRNRELLAGSVATLIAWHGCWSVWATVLWDRLGDEALLARLLGASRFRGTHADWVAHG